MFLIQKIAAQYPQRVTFTKHPAAVFTQAAPTLSALLHQRLRWGSKNKRLPEQSMKIALTIAWIFCTLLIITPCIGILFQQTTLLAVAGVAWLLKGMADFILLQTLARYFGQMNAMKYFYPALFLHTLYLSVVGTVSLFKVKYNWKGRKVA
jgi:hypothetical protein